MLRTLSVRNFAIIDQLELEFAPGFNVLTGETGAGKSILMGALNLLLGGRAGGEMVRSGANKATLDAVFDISGLTELQQIIEEMGYELEDDLLLLSREVNATGKSTCRISSRPATVTQLKEIGDWLVDLHGQHEHQSLLAVARHIDMLDTWGGKPLLELRSQIVEVYQTLQNLRQQKESLERDARERAHLLDLYQFQAQEIQKANLKVGEDDTLQAEHRRIANAQRLAENALEASAIIAGSDGEAGIVSLLSRAVRCLEDGVGIDESLQPMLEAVRSAYYELTEAQHDLSKYVDNLEFNEERLQEIEERLETLRNLKRKYGTTIQEVIQYGKETAEKLHQLTHSEELSESLEQEIVQNTKVLTELSKTLSDRRHLAAKEFQETTLAELTDLGLSRTRFEVLVSPTEPSSKGADRVEFMISTNPGEPLRPLAKVASGGEVSRVMLAIKSAMAKRGSLPTMVFDEIDVGVGGRTAHVIAEKMAHLAEKAQILCITHLAQLASRGQNHFYIEKQATNDETRVVVTPLTPENRVFEIARMMGAVELTDSALQHAKEMLSQAC